MYKTGRHLVSFITGDLWYSLVYSCVIMQGLSLVRRRGSGLIRILCVIRCILRRPVHRVSECRIFLLAFQKQGADKIKEQVTPVLLVSRISLCKLDDL